MQVSFNVLILILIQFITVFGQPIKSLNLEFTRVVQYSQAEEKTQGNIYFDGKKTTLIISAPINQWMIFENNRLLLYYPDARRAIEITSQNPASLPFFQAFIGIVKIDHGLNELGYTLAKNDMRGETLIVYWDPPKEAQKVLGPIIIGLKNDKIVFSQMKDAKGKILAHSVYQNHLKFSNNYFPLDIRTTEYTKNDSTVEHIIYRNCVFNEPLPQKVMNFQIPPEIKKEDVTW